MIAAIVIIKAWPQHHNLHRVEVVVASAATSSKFVFGFAFMRPRRTWWCDVRYGIREWNQLFLQQMNAAQRWCTPQTLFFVLLPVILHNIHPSFRVLQTIVLCRSDDIQLSFIELVGAQKKRWKLDWNKLIYEKFTHAAEIVQAWQLWWRWKQQQQHIHKFAENYFCWKKQMKKKKIVGIKSEKWN